MTQPNEKPTAATPPVEPPLRWVDIREFDLEGKAFSDVESFYDRLPLRAKNDVPNPVWELATHSAGMATRFVTDAPSISLRWRIRYDNLARDHMPATGVSGLDLYTKLRGKWRWLGVGRPTKFPENQFAAVAGMPPEPREMMLYLPLFNGIHEILVGVPENCTLQKAPPRTNDKPLCFYGTSIVHGGVASRPGMAYPAIIARRRDVTHFNFGFSGNGRSEPALAHLLAELNPAAYILDPLPNMTFDEVHERITPFVQILRQAHPRTPIILVESIVYQNGYLAAARLERQNTSNAALKLEFTRMESAGIPNLFYIPGDNLLGDDGEATVDGTHPTDAGFLRMAEVIGSVIDRALATR